MMMANSSGIAADRLRSFIERIERLEEEKAAIADDIKEVFAEAKSTGFDTKIMKMIIRLRKMDAQERSEQEQLLEVYAQAVGLSFTPIEAAIQAAEPEERDGPTPSRVSRADLDRAREDLKSRVDNLTKEPGASISVTTGGVTTTLKNVDGTRILEQTGEPPTDMGPPPKSVAGSVAALRTAMNAPQR